MSCRNPRRHFGTPDAAYDRLDEINAKPLTPDRMYSPTGVRRCHCGGFVLTSRSPKPWKTGKRGRNLRVPRRRG